MTLERITQKELASELDLITENGELSRRGVAELLRKPISRWGLAPRREVLRFVRSQLEASGIVTSGPSPIIGEILDQLVTFGECQEVSVGFDRYLVPCVPRWINTGNNIGILLTVGKIPEEIEIIESKNTKDIVRRIVISGEEDITALKMGGIRKSTIEEWIRPLDYLRYAENRLRQNLRFDELNLDKFWELLSESIFKKGQRLGDDSELRILSGQPGSFFGRYNATDCEGRWTTEREKGIWCGFRRGYGDNHWHPVITAIEKDQRVILDLYNQDEWHWALLARGVAMGIFERVSREENLIKLHFPAPLQLKTAMDLLGPHVQGWSWDVSIDAPDIWIKIFKS